MTRRLLRPSSLIVVLGVVAAAGVVLLLTSTLHRHAEEALPPPAETLSTTPPIPRGPEVGDHPRGGETETAGALMTRLEGLFRATPRILRLDVVTTRSRPRTPGAREELRVWGFLSGEPRTTSLLLVFTAPERMHGTGLMIRDPWGAGAADAMWYHMRTFRRFKEIPSSSLKLLVPGTCLTYEDARGFLSTDKYEFTFTEPSPGAAEARILARPKSAAWQSRRAAPLPRPSDRARRFLPVHGRTASGCFPRRHG